MSTKLPTRAEELLLLAVWRLQGNAYGATLRNHIAEVTGEDWSFGSIYPSLERLARKGYVRSYLGDPTPERGGRSKRYYELTAEGVTALNRLRNIQQSMWTALPNLGLDGAS